MQKYNKIHFKLLVIISFSIKIADVVYQDHTNSNLLEYEP